MTPRILKYRRVADGVSVELSAGGVAVVPPVKLPPLPDALRAPVAAAGWDAYAEELRQWALPPAIEAELTTPIVLDVDDPDLADQGWEAMPDGAGGRRFDADTTPLSRGPWSRTEPTPLRWPLRILLVAGESDDGAEIISELEALDGLLLDRRNDLVVEVLQPGVGLPALTAILNQFKPHVVHFAAHGRVLHGGEVMIGQTPLGPAQVQALLNPLGPDRPRLWVATACSTGARTAAPSLVHALRAAQVESVILMRRDIAVTAASAFANELYRAWLGLRDSVGGPQPLDVAIGRARAALETTVPGVTLGDRAAPVLHQLAPFPALPWAAECGPFRSGSPAPAPVRATDIVHLQICPPELVERSPTLARWRDDLRAPRGMLLAVLGEARSGRSMVAVELAARAIPTETDGGGAVWWLDLERERVAGRALRETGFLGVCGAIARGAGQWCAPPTFAAQGGVPDTPAFANLREFLTQQLGQLEVPISLRDPMDDTEAQGPAGRLLDKTTRQKLIGFLANALVSLTPQTGPLVLVIDHAHNLLDSARRDLLLVAAAAAAQGAKVLVPLSPGHWEALKADAPSAQRLKVADLTGPIEEPRFFRRLNQRLARLYDVGGQPPPPFKLDGLQMLPVYQALVQQLPLLRDT